MNASASSILRTKLNPPPIRADRISRTRLTNHFSASLERPVTLVCAPAGYGKTTLLCEWFVSETGKQFSLAWLSLDEDDNDPLRFLTYLVAALSTIDGLGSDEVLSLLQAPQPPPPKILLTRLISKLEAFTGRIALVLDDYHLITAQPVHEAVSFLLDHLPIQMSLVITSREDPPFPLSRLRGRDQLTEIRADELRFTPEEASQFLRQMLGITLNAEQVMELDTRTEGWIAGLQLVALALKGREDVTGFISAFTGSHRFVLDYLTDEVLSRQPEALRAFLLHTSILDRLNSALCDAVTGRSDGQAMLEQIERGNLFLIPLDDQRHWYRYHHLFGEMLRKHLQMVMVEDNVEALHRRASRGFADQKLIEEAISHAIAAHDVVFAAKLMEDSCRNYPVDSWGDRWIRLADHIPDDVMEHYPLLALDIGLRHAIIGEERMAEKQVQMVRATLSSASLPPTEMAELLGRADMIDGLNAVRSGNPQRAIDAAESTLQRIQEHQYQLRSRALKVKGGAYEQQQNYEQSRLVYSQIIEIGQTTRDVVMVINAMVRIADSFLIEGRLHDAEITCRSIIETAAIEKREYLPFVGGAWTELAVIQFEQNRLDEAAISAVHGADLCERVFPDGALACYTVLFRIHSLNRDRSTLQPVARAIQQILEDFPLMPARITAPLLTHLWTHDEVYAFFRQAMPQTKFQTSLLARQFLQLEQLRTLIEQGSESRLGEAFALLETLHTLLASSKPLICCLEMLILETLLLDASSQRDKALDTLAKALKLAEPEGFFRIFVDKGEVLARLVHAARIRNGRTTYVDGLLAAFENASSTAPSPPPSAALFEPLTERELEVLHLIAAGASNREIAEQLVVSIGTVKKHLNNIFLKLDVRSRTQAILTARRYNL